MPQSKEVRLVLFQCFSIHCGLLYFGLLTFILRYTARSITPPANRNGTSKSPPPTRHSPSRSLRPRSPKRCSMSRSPPKRHGRSRSRSRSRQAYYMVMIYDYLSLIQHCQMGCGTLLSFTLKYISQWCSTSIKFLNCTGARMIEIQGIIFISLDCLLV
jgi:hypothetical protein